MKMLMKLITALSIPLLILNVFGGIVSGIWLGILGEWRVVIIGILFFFSSTWLISLALMPAVLFVTLAAYFEEKWGTFGLLCFGAISSIYTLGLITVWCCGILFIFVKDANMGALIPRLIWSYGVAIGPWAYMASEEQRHGGENSASIMTTFFAAWAYIIIILLVLFSSITLLGAIKVFGVFMAVAFIIQMTVAVLIKKEQQKAAEQDIAFYE